MKRLPLLVLVGLSLSLVALPPILAQAELEPPQQNLWQEIGGVLGGACRFAGGGGFALPGVGTIPTGEIENLDWVCSLYRMYRFVDGSLLNGDWGEFAREVAGEWISAFSNELAGELGLGNLNAVADLANDGLRQEYRNFRLGMMRSMRQAITTSTNQPNLVNAPITTTQGLSQVYALQNPSLALGKELGREQRVVQAYKEAARSYRIVKSESESTLAVQEALGGAMNTANKIIGSVGIPGVVELPGTADALADRARTAISTREVAQIQVEAMATAMKSDALFHNQLMTVLAESAKQQVLVNAQLAELVSQTYGRLQGQADLVQARLEELAGENLEAGAELLRTAGNQRISVEHLFAPHSAESLVLE
jgi:hypothetical protein